MKLKMLNVGQSEYVTIASCYSCYHVESGHEDEDVRYKCTYFREKRSINYHSEIPEWCPLSTANSQLEERNDSALAELREWFAYNSQNINFREQAQFETIYKRLAACPSEKTTESSPKLPTLDECFDRFKNEFKRYLTYSEVSIVMDMYKIYSR